MPGQAGDVPVAAEATGSFADSSSSGNGASDRTALAPAFGAGDVVAGRYDVVRFITRGGMGEVYEVWDRDLRETVALKTIKPETASDGIERLRREVQLARRVTHANVCRIFDLGRHQDVNFLTMEFLDGETLAARLLRVGRMSPALALPIVRQVVLGLAAAHAAGIVHRDFKASNVLLVPAPDAERVVVADFGLARALGPASSGVDSLTGARLVGTPAYMAPEQVQGHPVGPAADIYALGVVLYELLTGRRPFAGDSPLATASRRLTEPPPAPRALVPDLDPNWDAAVRRCLQLRPQDRFGSVLDVLLALDGARSARARQLLLAGLLVGASVWLASGRHAPAAGTDAPGAIVTRAPHPADLGVPAPAPAEPRNSEPPPTRAAPLHVAGVMPHPAPTSPAPPPVSVATATPAPVTLAVESVPAPGPGHLKLLVIPWAEVTVDGRNVGTTPLAPLTLDAGTHVLLFSNPSFAPVSRVVHIDAGETLSLELDLRQVQGQ